MRAHRLGCLGLSLQPPARAPKPQGCGGGIYLGNQPSTSLAKKAPQDREASQGGRGPGWLSVPGTAGRRHPAWGGRRCWPGPGSALRGQRVFFRERLPWVTRLRGDTALPSPSGNLSIGEIDNPQRRAAHPLSSPCCGARRPKVAPLAGRGRCPDPSSAMTWPLQPVGEAPKGSLGDPPPDECSQGLLRVLASTARVAGTRGAPLWLGQNLVECRSCFFSPSRWREGVK